MRIAERRASDEPRFARILLLVTEDWFVLSHFKPLVAVLREFAREVAVPHAAHLEGGTASLPPTDAATP